MVVEVLCSTLWAVRKATAVNKDIVALVTSSLKFYLKDIPFAGVKLVIWKLKMQTFIWESSLQ